MNFEIYRSRKQYRWRLKGDNGEILAHGEAYKRWIDCMKVVDLVMLTTGDTPINDLSKEK